MSALAGRFSTGEIADDLGSNFGWSNTQTFRIKTFLQQHRASIDNTMKEMERFASTAIAGTLVIPILAIFFLSDGEKLANHIVHLISTSESYEAVRVMAAELHVMLQHYIRAKVLLGLLSLGFCTAAMLALAYSVTRTGSGFSFYSACGASLWITGSPPASWGMSWRFIRS